MKKTKKAVIAAVLCASMTLAGCSNNDKKPETTSAPAQTQETQRPEPTMTFKYTESTAAGNSGSVNLEKGDTYAVISVKDFGDIKVKLFPDIVPYAVYNFTELAKKGTYSGYKFHRLIENFMIQSGSANGAGGGSKSIDGGEFKNDINTSLRHYYGALCYASNGMGDISDGFYIVNSKVKQTDLASLYDNSSSNFGFYASIYKQYADSSEPTTDDEKKTIDLYKRVSDYNMNASLAATAMKNTITDAVTKTYSETGGAPSLDGAYTVFGQTVEGFDVIDKITAVEKEPGEDGAISKPVNEIIIDKVEIFTME